MQSAAVRILRMAITIRMLFGLETTLLLACFLPADSFPRGMSSLKKRATWGMVISLVCLVAGIALLCFAHDSLDHVFKKVVTDIEKTSADDLAVRMAVGTLPLIAGASLTLLGVVLLPLSLATWIRNPSPGSKLGFRDWTTPDQMTESDVAQDKAWRAILWGYLASQAWILQLCTGGYRGLLSHTSFTLKILLFEITMCTVFYALGIRLCRRRDPASVAAAPWSWKAALALNYGGLLVFLGLVGALFFIRFRA